MKENDRIQTINLGAGKGMDRPVWKEGDPRITTEKEKE